MQGPCLGGLQAIQLGVALAIVASFGCGAAPVAPTGRPPVAQVVGTVTRQGQPVQNAIVQFHPDSGGDRGTGHTDQSGKFTISTYGPQDGAVVGTHVVTVTPLPDVGAVPGVDSPSTSGSFPEAYASPEKSPLTVEVEEKKNSFELELK
ncbi:MAG: hypothetical protein WD045_17745 [Pirellulaceae bacterium]